MQEQEVDPRRCCWQRQEAMETSGFVMASGPVNADCRRRARALKARGLPVLKGRFHASRWRSVGLLRSPCPPFQKTESSPLSWWLPQAPRHTYAQSRPSDLPLQHQDATSMPTRTYSSRVCLFSSEG